MIKICVFCGSSPGRNPAYKIAAKKTGQLFAEKNLALVYGGATIGLMGIIADACLMAGGEVIGIIPEALVSRESVVNKVEHSGLTRLEIVDSMHSRKARMAELADGFIALPGGIGTFEEFFEIFTWSQLGFHQKPIGLLNVDHYFDPLIELCDQAVEQGFLGSEIRARMLIHEEPLELLTLFQNNKPDSSSKVWIHDRHEL